jgi:uracil-DNA glycosylase
MLGLTKEKYSTYRKWTDCFPDGKVLLKKLYIKNIFDNVDEPEYLKYFDNKHKKILKKILNAHKLKSWNELFDKLFSMEKIKKIEENLSKEVKSLGLKHMYPLPDLLFSTFNFTTLNRLSVVIIGQDPYGSCEDIDNIDCVKDDHENNIYCPEAMGLSFSVPKGIKIPSSLQNIYKNLIKYGHIEGMPTHGNLESWALQGCLMLNSSLTVLDGSMYKNCHQNVWKWFTDEIIKYISKNMENIIFVLWGNNALEKMNMIDLDKHEAIVSSHPSGFSVDKPLKNYSSFKDFDHFGKINSFLKKMNKPLINWKLT